MCWIKNFGKIYNRKQENKVIRLYSRRARNITKVEIKGFKP